MNTKTLRKRKAPATLAYHPTKGYRRVSLRRQFAQVLMTRIYQRARQRAAA